jgi:FRG domain
MKDSDYPINWFGSVDQLCSLISSGTKGWDTKWFRGSISPAHGLLPKLFRDPAVAKREGYIAVEFRRRAHLRLKLVHSQFEWLCAMQHYGFPTRLLDWSESFAVALFFTTAGDIDSVVPTIWVLDPFKLHALTDPTNEVIPTSDDEIVRANADIAFEDNWKQSHQAASKYPIPVAPNFLFDRLAMQNGTFTIHGTDSRPIDQIIPADQRGMLLKFVAKPSKIEAIRDCIDLVKPSPDSIFPDIEGIKDYIV